MSPILCKLYMPISPYFAREVTFLFIKKESGVEILKVMPDRKGMEAQRVSAGGTVGEHY